MSRHALVADAWRERLAAAGLADLDPLLDERFDRERPAGCWECLSKEGLGERQRWRWSLPAENGDGVVFVKRYQGAPPRMQWDRILRQNSTHSRAQWEFVQAERLREACIAAPLPVGFVERMRGRFESRSAVLLERVAGDGVDRVWTAAERDGSPITVGLGRHDFVKRMARFVSAFHGTGLCHRDLYLCHVFVELDPDNALPPRFAIIDLARAHRPRWRRMRWLLKDLAQLDYSARAVGATRADRYRFLLAYLGLQCRAPRARWYARRIASWSDRILARERRKGRA